MNVSWLEIMSSGYGTFEATKSTRIRRSYWLEINHGCLSSSWAPITRDTLIQILINPKTWDFCFLYALTSLSASFLRLQIKLLFYHRVKATHVIHGDCCIARSRLQHRLILWSRSTFFWRMLSSLRFSPSFRNESITLRAQKTLSLVYFLYHCMKMRRIDSRIFLIRTPYTIRPLLPLEIWQNSTVFQ